MPETIIKYPDFIPEPITPQPKRKQKSPYSFFRSVVQEESHIFGAQTKRYLGIERLDASIIPLNRLFTLAT
jgi:hypothetical protein